MSYKIIEWDARFMLGFSLFDKQHEKLAQLTNQLYFACLQGSKTANRCFEDALHEAVAYVKYHFATEEKMMFLLDYPDFSTHKKTHESFIKEVLNQSQSFSANSHLAPNRFVHYLKDWILSHIAVSDKVMVEFILHNKYHEKLQLLFPKSA